MKIARSKIVLVCVLSLAMTGCQPLPSQMIATDPAEPSFAQTAAPVETKGPVSRDIRWPTERPPLNKPPRPEASKADRSQDWIYDKYPQMVPVNYDSPALLHPTDDQGQSYLDRITFICDSPTYWLWPFGMLKDGKNSTQVWTGPEGTMTLAYQGTYEIWDPIDRVRRPIREVILRHPPDILVIALGINGISFMKEDYFVAEYTDLVEAVQTISPQTIIILQSIYPITRRYKHWGSITNVKISAGNSWILKIAEKTGCYYLDTFSVLIAENGEAQVELMKNDGLHPNREGLQLILEYIRRHGYRQIKRLPPLIKAALS